MSALHVRRFEPSDVPSAPPVLLVHGFASDGEADWCASGWPEVLTAAGRVVLVPDLPGHGGSTAPEDVTTSAMVQQLVDVITEEGATAVDVIGYSLGARLSWELPRASTVPVQHLVLGGLSPDEPFNALEIDELLAFANTGAQPADPFTNAVANMISAPGQDPGALARCIDGLRREPFTPTTGDVTVPTLFVFGREDTSGQGAERLVRLVEHGEVVQVPGDHGAALHEAKFREAATAFLGAPAAS